MEPQGGNGPDGTSLKPVSSLRSHFENMGKQPQDAPTPAASPLAATPTPVRLPSPKPKPPPVPDTRPPRKASPAQPEAAASEKPIPGLTVPSLNDTAPRSPRIGNPPPPLSPRPMKPPPSVMIEPPQSPPKGRLTNVAPGDANSLLYPDPVKNTTPTTPTASSPRNFKISSRPITPVLEPRKSPRLTPSQPPSPPPPRRSGELKRDRDARAAATLPPPINRAEKPLIPNRSSLLVEQAPKLVTKSEKHSPFSSPPSSASSPEMEEPPSLPTRPAARPTAQKIAPPRTKTLPAAFDPPPVHHTVANRRKEAETNGNAKAPSLPTPTEERAPALPVRPVTVTEPATTRSVSRSLMPPPPRPPRAGIPSPSTTVPEPSSLPPKRIVSTPTTQSQQQPLPQRTHGRSMTVDRTSDRTPAEFRIPITKVEGAQTRNRVASGTATAGRPCVATSAFPDSAYANRRPPFSKQGANEIFTKYDTRIFDVSGQYVCTSGHLTRVWSLLDGEQLMSFAHGEGVKATAVAFKPAAHVSEEGSRLWIGNNIGEVMEADVASQSIVGTKTNAHGRHEVIKIYRHFNEMWTLDDGGTLHVWGPDSEGLPKLGLSPHQTFRLPKVHSFSLIIGDDLWHASGREIRVFAPTFKGREQFQVLVRPLTAEGAAEVTSGTLVKTQPGKVFFGHSDGKISIFNYENFSCIGVCTATTYKINSLAGVGPNIWAGFNTGRICVYDIETDPWVTLKDWQAHDNPVIKLTQDRASFYNIDRSQVISLGADNVVRSWDGLLQDDWLEHEMRNRDTQYCEFDNIKTLITTWNAGASTPTSLRYSDSDAKFIQDLIQSSGTPDILVFGFQELVDLEDKTATAKRLFKSKKKDPHTDQERMSHQYRDWRDFLVRSLDDYMPDSLYHLQHTATLVGLFTCIFVKSTLRDRIRNMASAQIKRGMGGLHGNKGAIIVRFLIDDSSLCFINCHLAAGQSQASSRHNDIQAIMEASSLPVERDTTVRMDNFVGGGDGSMVLDHELCVLNGDLNYRIDTMSRDTVVNAVKTGNLTKLLDRDQLLVARRRNPAFRLRAFEEMPITFAPTYKYDVGTDNYDTSEKRRSPAWCDRLLYRGRGRITQVDYKRHEVRVSDHRPVSGRFKFMVKKIDPEKRAMSWAECLHKFEEKREREAAEEKLFYLTNVIGYDMATSQKLIREKDSRRLNHSPSRRRV